MAVSTYYFSKASPPQTNQITFLNDKVNSEQSKDYWTGEKIKSKSDEKTDYWSTDKKSKSTQKKDYWSTDKKTKKKTDYWNNNN
ncbi:hypothetical protein KH5_23560 [Urechidicola sp. KH5]